MITCLFNIWNACNIFYLNKSITGKSKFYKNSYDYELFNLFHKTGNQRKTILR